MEKEKRTEKQVEEQETKKAERTNTSDGVVIQLN